MGAMSAESFCSGVANGAASSVHRILLVLPSRDVVSVPIAANDRRGDDLDDGAIHIALEDDAAEAAKTAILRPASLSDDVSSDLVAKSAMAGLLRRDDPEVTRQLELNIGKEGAGSSSDLSDDDDGLKTVARKLVGSPPNERNVEPLFGPASELVLDDETLSREAQPSSPSNPSALGRPREKAEAVSPLSYGSRVEETATTLRRNALPPPPLDEEQATIRRSDAAPGEPTGWSLAAVDPSPPLSPTIRTPLVMVKAEDDSNLTRISPLALQGASALARVSLAPSSSPDAPRAPSHLSPQRVVAFIAGTLLVAAIVFIVLRPRQNTVSAGRPRVEPTPVMPRVEPPLVAPPVANLSPAVATKPTAPAPTSAPSPSATTARPDPPRRKPAVRPPTRSPIPVRREQ